MLHRTKLFSMAACILLLFAGGLPVHAEDIDTAREQFRTGKYEECLELTRKAIENSTYRSRRHLWALMVESLLATGRYHEAAKEADLALLRYPMSSRFLKLAHTAHQYCGQSERATEMLKKIYRYGGSFKLEFWDPPDLVALGQALLLLGSEPKIVLEQIFNRALRVDPNCRQAYLASAQLALDKQDFELAADQFRKALERFGDDPDVHCGLAEAFCHSDRSAMIKSLDAALFINPNHVPSLLLLAEHQIDCEDYDSASELLDRALTVNPRRPETWALRAVISYLSNEPNAVQRCRANALKYWSTNPAVDYLIGKKLSQKYRFSEGAQYQRQALKFDPEYLAAKIQLTEDLLRLGDESTGWTMAEEVYQADEYNVLAYNLLNLRDSMAGLKTLSDEGFVVRMDELEAAVYGKRVLKLLQRAKSQLCQKYGIELTEPVTVELFPNQQDFAVRTFGMPGGDGFLGVCFGNVITANSPRASRAVNWEATLWHEFCHVVTLNMTKNKMPRWLSEGISVYEERQHNPAWGQHMNPGYRKMILEGQLIPIGELSSAFLSPPTPMHLQFAYYESSLVVEFIVQQYGLESLKAILADLASGEEINSVISRRTGPLSKIEKLFEKFARRRAENLAPDADWTKPKEGKTEHSDFETLAAWLAEHPNSFWALQLQAGRLIEDENWQQAVKPLEKLISIYPNHTGEGNAYSLLAQVYRKLGETEMEREVLERLCSISADSVDAYRRLLEIAAEQQDWRSVLANGNRYIAVYPMLASVHRRMGAASEELGLEEEAIESYKRVLVLDPQDPADINYRLARLYHGRDPEAAKRYVLEALSDAPRFRKAHSLLLSIVHSTGSEDSPPESVSDKPEPTDENQGG
jgi:tetratricopeptide (TPR) repeat protein